MGNWKKMVAAMAALPMAFAGLAIGAGTAAAADADAVPLASFNFNNDDGFTGNGAVAAKQGNVALADGNDGTKAAKLGSGAWLNITKDDGTSLLKGLDDVTISYDRRADTSGNTGWTVFAASNNAAQTYGNEHYLGFLDKIDGLTVERYNNSGKRVSDGNLTNKASRAGWNHVELTVSGKDATLKVDGTEVATNTAGPALTDILGDKGGVLQIGKANWGNGEYFSGLIDNLTISTTAQGAAQQAAAFLDFGIKGDVTGDVTLPVNGLHGATVTWASDNEAVINPNTGKVTPAAADTSVKLTATVTVNGATATRTFTLTVPAAITDSAQVADKLLVNYQLTDGVKLPTSLYGATIAWSTAGDGAKLVAANGTVTGADGDEAKTVDLTATITFNGKTATKTFKAVRVMPKNAQTLASYTRDHSINGGARVGDALHLALGGGGKFTALNTDYGVAFAEAKITVGANNNKGYPTQATDIRGLIDPYLFQMKDGKYAYVAAFTDVNGNRVDGGQIAFSTSDDLMEWSGKPNEDERGDMVTVTDDTTVFDAGSIAAGYDASADDYRISWQSNGVAKYVTTKDFKTFSDVRNGTGFARTAADLSGVANAVSSNTMMVTKAVAANLTERLGRVHNTGVEQPTKITVKKGSSVDELKQQIVGGVEQKDGTLSKGKTLKAEYSDGSTFDFRVNWNEDQLKNLNTDEVGKTTIEGTANQQNYSEQFPMMSNRADPNIVYYKGKYYAMGTSDTGGMHTLFIRSSDTLAGLKDQKAGVTADGGYKVEGQDVYLFGDNDGLGHKGYHWAPELHVINGKLYCFYATVPDKAYGGPNWVGTAPVAYVMELKDGGDPTKTADWIEHRVQRQLVDGSLDNLSNLGLTIDMTYFEVDGKAYIAWSQGDEERAGAKANVSIAQVDPDKPWVALTTPQRIMRPEWGWELDGVNEGPNVLVSGGKVYMVFSAQLVTPQYATGMLIANVGDDLTKASSWTKSNYPWLHNGTFAGQYGLGHNSYFADPYGDVYNVYHAMTNATRNTNRHAGVVPVHFRADGTPIIDMTTTEELQKEFAAANYVKLTVEVVDDLSSNANLDSLTVAGIAIDDLDKAASKDGVTVKVDDPDAVKSTDVVAKVADGNATRKVTVENRVVKVKVTAQDGTTKTYTVTLEAKDGGTTTDKPDKSELQRLYDAVKDYRAADYKAGWDAFVAARDAAAKVLADAAASQDDVNGALDALDAAVAGLKKADGNGVAVTPKPDPEPSDKPGSGSGNGSGNGGVSGNGAGGAGAGGADADANGAQYGGNEQKSGSLSKTGAAVGAVALVALALAGAGVALSLRRRRS
ncbi:family 43 glycosylhydrolase [Bifidobacterium catulorum]|uniref:Atrophied bacterial Ig domain-containing protein n=1 Tax=Bifidobacterium catulorum TaxID=1630173 RepID=A0A2U2MQP9_9BIFI|nr:family 43 glycosylhydrolase [Bifidobacterium catulorum]PWG59163.1 hypothetical protein DF200_09045 [Bifidobacterium catulorum]